MNPILHMQRRARDIALWASYAALVITLALAW